MPRSHDSRRFAPGRTGEAGPLGRLESAVMEAVWALRGAASVADVQEAILPAGPIAYNTVKTTMERLAEKGILTRTRESKAYLYTAAVTRGELERRIVSTMMDRLVEQFPEAVASFFVHPETTLSHERLSLLREAILRERETRDG